MDDAPRYVKIAPRSGAFGGRCAVAGASGGRRRARRGAAVRASVVRAILPGGGPASAPSAPVGMPAGESVGCVEIVESVGSVGSGLHTAMRLAGAPRGGSPGGGARLVPLLPRKPPCGPPAGGAWRGDDAGGMDALAAAVHGIDAAACVFGAMGAGMAAGGVFLAMRGRRRRRAAAGAARAVSAGGARDTEAAEGLCALSRT